MTRTAIVPSLLTSWLSMTKPLSGPAVSGRSWVAAVVSVALAASVAPIGAGVHAVPVDAGGAGVHAGAVRDLAPLGVFEGTHCASGDWCWGEPVERVVAAVWLVRVLDTGDSGVVSGVSRFADVDASDRWAGHVERLAELGITVGCSEEPLLFCPDKAVSRAQMASFLVRAFGLGEAPSAGFGDTAGSVHEGSIDALFAAGVTVGCQAEPSLFCPLHSTTRAQMASFLNRARTPDTDTGATDTGGGGSGGGGFGGGALVSGVLRATRLRSGPLGLCLGCLCGRVRFSGAPTRRSWRGRRPIGRAHRRCASIGCGGAPTAASSRRSRRRR